MAKPRKPNGNGTHKARVIEAFLDSRGIEHPDFIKIMHTLPDGEHRMQAIIDEKSKVPNDIPSLLTKIRNSKNVNELIRPLQYELTMFLDLRMHVQTLGYSTEFTSKLLSVIQKHIEQLRTKIRAIRIFSILQRKYGDKSLAVASELFEDFVFERYLTKVSQLIERIKRNGYNLDQNAPELTEFLPEEKEMIINIVRELSSNGNKPKGSFVIKWDSLFRSALSKGDIAVRLNGLRHPDFILVVETNNGSIGLPIDAKLGYNNNSTKKKERERQTSASNIATILQNLNLITQNTKALNGGKSDLKLYALKRLKEIREPRDGFMFGLRTFTEKRNLDNAISASPNVFLEYLDKRFNGGG